MHRPQWTVLGAIVGLIAGLIVDLAGMSSTASAATSTWCAAHNNVAIVGTSAETGYGTTGYPSGADTFQRTTYGWVTRYSDSLHAQWGTTVHDYAHNGALASDYLPGGRWTSTIGATGDMQTYSPDLVIVDLGGNEFWSQVDPSTFAANLGQVIDNIRAARPGVDILMSIYATLHWAPNPQASTETWTWPQYASVIYNTAVAKGTALVDMRQYVADADSTTPPIPSTWDSDLIHQNDAGNLAEQGAFWGWTSSIASIC